MILRNHYETLGINKGAGDDEIRKAYHRLAKLYHPDKNADPKAEEKFKEVGQAYEVMKNKDRREIWEREFARQNTTLREQRTNKETPTKRAESSKTSRKPTKTSPKKTTTNTDYKSFNFKTGSTDYKAKYKFFFTDSDYDSDDDIGEKPSEKANYKRRASYAGEKSSAQWNPPSTDNEKENWNNFDFGFNFYMDTEDGFQTFFDPFHMFYEWQDKQHRFRDFEEDAEEFFASFKADCKEKRSQAKKCAGDDGDKDWYDWTRVFNPMDSDDDANDSDKLACAFCRKQMSAELLRKHESRCRRFSGGPDILAFRLKQAQVETDRRRRSSLQQESRTNVPRDELITCMFCYRKFNQKVADRHIDFCAKQTFQTGRPMNPLGKSAAARDYSSKNYTAKEYAKTVPKPKMSTSGKRRPSPPQSAEGSRDNNNNTNSTTNGASNTNNNPAPKPSDKTKPPAFRKPAAKPKLIDVNILPNNGKFTSSAGGQGGVFPGEGCSTCQRQYGPSTSRVTCSCGVRKSFSS